MTLFNSCIEYIVNASLGIVQFEFMRVVIIAVSISLIHQNNPIGTYFVVIQMHVHYCASFWTL